jgi:hypothetical protein
MQNTVISLFTRTKIKCFKDFFLFDLLIFMKKLDYLRPNLKNQINI